MNFRKNKLTLALMLATPSIATVIPQVVYAAEFKNITSQLQLLAAIQQAKNGDTIQLAPPSWSQNSGGYIGSIREIDVNGKEYTFNKDITIDLNGNELIFRGVTVVNEGNLTLQNGTIGVMNDGSAPGKIFNTETGSLSITGSAKLRPNDSTGKTLTSAEFINEGKLFIDQSSNQKIHDEVQNQGGTFTRELEATQPNTPVNQPTPVDNNTQTPPTGNNNVPPSTISADDSAQPPPVTNDTVQPTPAVNADATQPTNNTPQQPPVTAGDTTQQNPPTAGNTDPQTPAPADNTAPQTTAPADNTVPQNPAPATTPAPPTPVANGTPEQPTPTPTGDTAPQNPATANNTTPQNPAPAGNTMPQSTAPANNTTTTANNTSQPVAQTTHVVLSEQAYLSVLNQMLQNSARMLKERIEQQQHRELIDGEENLWAKVVTSWGESKHAEKYKTNQQAVVIGFDKTRENVRLGYAVGVSQDQAEIASREQEWKAKSVYSFIYGDYQMGNVKFDAQLGGNYSRVKSERYSHIAQEKVNGKFSVFGVQAGLGASYNLGTFIPFARLDFHSTQRKTFTETGKKSSFIQYLDRTPSLIAKVGTTAKLPLTSNLSVNAVTSIGVETLNKQPFAVYESENRSYDIGRTIVNTGIDLNYTPIQNLTISAGYDGEFRNNFNNHRAIVNATWQF